MPEQTYLEQFQNRDLTPQHFDHRGHLYMAWVHLRYFPLEQAKHLVCEGIRDLATKFEAPEKYNHTLTEALMRIIYRRMQSQSDNTFKQFLKQNPDLLNNAEVLLTQHYSRRLLTSEQARTTWQEPDLAPL